MSRRSASLTFSLSWCDRHVNACIWRWPPSGIVQQGRRSVVYWGRVSKCGGGTGGFALYMTHGVGGAIFPMVTLSV